MSGNNLTKRLTYFRGNNISPNGVGFCLFLKESYARGWSFFLKKLCNRIFTIMFTFLSREKDFWFLRDVSAWLLAGLLDEKTAIF
jgi:hypothetical protein